MNLSHLIDLVEDVYLDDYHLYVRLHPNQSTVLVKTLSVELAKMGFTLSNQQGLVLTYERKWNE